MSSRPIPDIEQLLQEEYEDDDVNVKIIELSSDTLQKKDLVIGDNKPKENMEKKKPKKIKDTDIVKEIPGMGLEEESAEESEQEEDGDDKLKTKKEIKSILKKQATKKIQKSKVFQMKSKLDRIQNKKKSLQKNNHMKGKANPRKTKSDARNGKVDSRKPKADLRKHKSKKKGGRRKQ